MKRARQGSRKDGGRMERASRRLFRTAPEIMLAGALAIPPRCLGAMCRIVERFEDENLDWEF